VRLPVSLLLFLIILTTFILIVLSPTDPTTGLEVGTSKKWGKKRERSATLEHTNTGPSAPKKVARGESYTLIWYREHKLLNLMKLSKWAKYKFRHELITGTNPYPNVEKKLIAAAAVYDHALAHMPNDPPEASE
jgi:hypothetical protein